jgi:hypothetical protein
MRQRLGLAYALLGDPGVLVLDEPANGLDPEGIRWMRGFLQQLAREGRTVLVSSHQLAEVQQTADALLIISRGQLVFQGTIDELSDPSEHATVVDAPDRAALAAALERTGVGFEVLRSGLTVRGMDPVAVGAAAAEAGVALSSLQRRGPALEEVFLDLVNGTRVHASAAGGLAMVEEGIAAAAPAPVVEAQPESAPVEEAAASSQPAQAPVAEPEPEAPAIALAEPMGEEVPAADEPAATESAGPIPEPHETAREASATALPPEAQASFAVASTGIIDIVPQGDLRPDADEDVEAIGEIDEELSSERPWENHVRTDADLEADRFFGRFDDEDDHASESAGSEPETEPPSESGAEPEASAPPGTADPDEPEDADGERVEGSDSPPEPESGESDDAAAGSTGPDQRDDAEGGEQR